MRKSLRPRKSLPSTSRRTRTRASRLSIPAQQQKCPGHRVAVQVLRYPVPVYAGGKQHETRPPDRSVIIDLANGYPLPVRVEGITVPGLRQRVSITWPDMSVPDMTAADWRALARALVRNRRPVFVACGFGHGRTGTALAILAHFMRAVPKGLDPVDFIRRVYCEEAVETAAQVAYISQMTGVKVTQKGSQGATVQGYRVTPKIIETQTDNLDECQYRSMGHAGCDRYGHFRARF